MRLVMTPSFEAYRLYVDAQRRAVQWMHGDAIRLHRAAIALDPDFASAWLGLSYSYGMRGFRDSASMCDDEALRHPDRLNAAQREGIEVRRAFSDGDFARVLATYDRILAEDPGNWRALGNSCDALWGLGRIEEALERTSKAISLAPFGPPDVFRALPTVPFFNAAQVFASNIQAISFQNGSGIRFLTEYAQYAAPVNNHELVYHFQGFSDDGEYYIIAIFPITAPALAETSDAEAAVPDGGIAYPDINDPNADFQGYYASITDLLNATSPEVFTPSISQLDALIQSMQVAP